MTPELSPASRERILDFVRPLSVGLDGMTNFNFVERRLRMVSVLAEREGCAVDDARLFLLTAFTGLPDRRVAAGGRAELLLTNAGVPKEEIARLFRSLKRVDTDPKTAEERLVHDAALLETVGAYGVTQILVAGTRERMTIPEMAEEIERKMDGAVFATDAARALAEDRLALARRFAKRLAEEAAEFA